MKKGFTLIELLAVIVILAIIALIAVPIVLNIINDSKESSGLRSAEFYLDAVEYTIADTVLYHGGLEDKEYPITKDGDICKIELDNEGNCPKTGDKSNTLKVEVNGEKPTGGSISIEHGKIINVSITLNGKTIIKNGKEELKYDDSKKPTEPEEPKNYICVLDTDINNIGKLDTGDKVVCGNEVFYVIDVETSNAEMLAYKNINVTGSGDVKQMDNAGVGPFIEHVTYPADYWCYYWHGNCSHTGFIQEGLSAEYGASYPAYVFSSSSSTYRYVEEYKNYLNSSLGLNVLEAKLISIESFTKLENVINENWLYSPGYWLGTSPMDEHVYTTGPMGVYGRDESPSEAHKITTGVRPVITISKEDIKISN